MAYLYDFCNRGGFRFHAGRRAMDPLLQDLMGRSNIKLLIGNHEYLMAALLSKVKGPVTGSTVLDDRMLAGLGLWFDNGGRPTFLEFLTLPPNKQKRMRQFLVKLPLYTEVTVASQSYILVRSGFDHFSLSRELADYEAGELLFHRHDSEPYYPDKTVITGHTPTFEYGKEYAGRIGKRNGTFNIDCGCAYSEGRVPGCLRLDDQKEFYVTGMDVMDRH